MKAKNDSPVKRRALPSRQSRSKSKPPAKDSYSSVGCTGNEVSELTDKPRVSTCCSQAGEPAPSSTSLGQRGKVPKRLSQPGAAAESGLPKSQPNK